jgi:hypothetical protein
MTLDIFKEAVAWVRYEEITLYEVTHRSFKLTKIKLAGVESFTYSMEELYGSCKKYSAYNHKRATAAKCRESHHRRMDCTLAIGKRHSSSCIRSAVV